MLLRYQTVPPKSHWPLLVLGFHVAVAWLHGEDAVTSIIEPRTLSAARPGHLHTYTHSEPNDQNGIHGKQHIIDKTKADWEVAHNVDTYATADIAKAHKLATFLAHDTKELAKSLQKMRPLLYQFKAKHHQSHRKYTTANTTEVMPSSRSWEGTSSKSQHSLWNAKNLEPFATPGIDGDPPEITPAPLMDGTYAQPPFEQLRSKHKRHPLVRLIHAVIIVLVASFVVLWMYHSKRRLREAAEQQQLRESQGEPSAEPQHQQPPPLSDQHADGNTGMSKMANTCRTWFSYVPSPSKLLLWW